MNVYSYLNKQRKFVRFSIYILFILLPWVLLFLVLTLISHQPLSKLTPIWNDEIIYWHEVLSFSSKGFNFGYYTINELTPKVLSFGHHGFGTLIPYTFYSKIFGWNFNSMAISNTIFMSLAFVFLLILTKPDIKKVLSLSLFYITFSGAILYCSTSMTEMLNFAAILVYFALLFSYSTQKKKHIFYLIIAFTVAISFIRIIYIVLFIPIFILKIKENFSLKKIISYTILWIVLSAVLFLINSLFQSPYPESFLYQLFSKNTVFEYIIDFIKHFFLNSARYIYPLRDDPIQIAQRYLIIVFLVYLFRKSNITKDRRNINIDYFIAFITLFITLLITISAYDVFNWRDYRVLAPIVFGSISYLILTNKSKLAQAILIINIVALAIIFIPAKTTNFFFTDSQRFVNPKKISIFEKIVYNPDALNPFENTLIVDQYNKETFLNVPAGIRITYADSISDDLKSQWIWTLSEKELTNYRLIASEEGKFLYKKKE